MMKSTLCSLIFSLVLAGSSSAVSMGYNLFQDGFSGGGTLTGMIFVEDLNANGQVTYFRTVSGPQEVTALSLQFSGNDTVPDFTVSLANVTGLQWDLDPVFGDGSGGGGLLKEGMKMNMFLGGTFYQYLTGFSAFGTGPVQGHIRLGAAGAVLTQTGNFALASPVPSGGATITMLGMGLLGMGALFRKRARTRKG